ncbi:hypothetical protein OC844_006841, partial [Tilletia horrida]
FVGMRSISISVFATWLLLCCVAAVLVGGSRPVEYPDLLNAQISDLRRGLERGHWTSVDLVKAYLARIDEVNHKGPKLNAVTEVAVVQAVRRLPSGEGDGIDLMSVVVEWGLGRNLDE